MIQEWLKGSDREGEYPGVAADGEPVIGRIEEL